MLMAIKWTSNLKRKSISWLLIALMLELFFLPTHLHLHHLDINPVTSHSHTIDVHVISDILDQSHHEGATQIDTDSNILIKQINDNLVVAFILIAMILILAVTRRTTWYRRLRDTGRFKYCYYTLPPLRAPPLIS